MRRGFWTAFATLLLVVSVEAKGTNAGVVEGVVRDESGGVLPGVTVSLAGSGASDGAPAVQITDGGGEFHFDGLPPGSYRLVFSLSGFEEKSVVASPGGGPSLQVTLALASMSETVTVRDEVALVDVTEASGESEVANEVLDAAPLSEERFQDSLPLLPSVVRGPDGLINVNGARSSQSGFLLNGANVTDPVTGDFALQLPLDAVESVKVYQSVYSAEFGQVSSGTTDVATRRGSDRWSFSFNNFFPRPRIIDGSFQGIDKATPRSRLAGPIVKGKLWFSQAWNYRFVRSRVDELPIHEGAEVLEGFDSVTQLDYQIDPRNSLTGAFTLFPSDVESLGIDTLHPFEASPDQKTRGFHLSLAERASFGASALLETLLSIQKFDLSVAPKSDASSLLTVDGLRGNYFNRFDRESLRVEWKQSFSKELRLGGQEHTWKAGYDVARTEYDGLDESLPIDLLRADGTRFERIEWAGDPEVGAENTEFAAFLQDRWRPSPALQLDLGLRYDHEEIAPEHHVAPRLAGSFSPFADGKTVFKGGFGIFYDKVLLNVADFERRQRRVITYFGPDGETPLGPAIELANRIEGDALHTPRSVNWHVEVDRLLSERLMIRVRYGERHGTNELVVDPILSPDGRGELRLSSGGRSRSRELEITGRGRFSRESELFVSYVRAEAEGDLNDFGTLFGNVRDPVIWENEFSLLPFDYRDRLLVWGVVHLPKKITLSPVLEIHTGFPLTVLDEEQRPVGGRSRGGRFPAQATMDLKATKEVSMGFHGVKALLGLQLFNVLGRFNPRDFQDNLASASFGSFRNSVGTQVRLKFTLLF